jgi:SPP1 gp7 family putative phage head morphogenesis protein
MLAAIARGIRAVAKAIRNAFKSTNTEKRAEEEEPEKRKYKVSAIRDAKTCKVCSDKDGTTFEVSSDDSVGTIAARMSSSVPPFHINCRCTLQRVS